MKYKNILLVSVLVMFSLALGGCKKNNWIDWKVQNEAWLAANKTADGVIVTPTGLQYKVIRQGIKSVKPDELKSVTVNYKASLITGFVFEQKDGADFSVSGLISGVAEGLKKMNVSGHYILYIPADLGYGEDEKGAQGSSSYIPPYSTLIFDIELTDVY